LLKPGEKLISEEDEPKDFYVLAEGTLLHTAVGERVNINVRI
jgi:CRP-like cAMP-binding protein